MRVSNVHTEMNTAGNAVDRARKYFANAYRRNRVRRSAGLGLMFNRQYQFRGSAKRIAAIGHQHSASMPAHSLDRNSKTGWRSDFADNPEWNLFLFQQWPLFDVQFHKRFVMSRW